VGGGGKGGRRAAQSACDVSKCGICVGRELVEKLIACFSALLLIFIQRWLCSAGRVEIATILAIPLLFQGSSPLSFTLSSQRLLEVQKIRL
jgi:hypothetical protein